ncbi:hypothetical protein [Levilactobacillus brevis]|uniref:hypothetical protein n=1 Tax=Levilactobacillus brevis TaxID=1580 RepID=UPI0015C46782|nr:hypothetical protein [Levilactobacillus brevis]
MRKNRYKYNFPTVDSETLMDCFVSFYNAHPDAKNIELIKFGNKAIEISWE